MMQRLSWTIAAGALFAFAVCAWIINVNTAWNFVWPKWLMIQALGVLLATWALGADELEGDAIDVAGASAAAWMIISVMWSPDPLAGWHAAIHVMMLWLVFVFARRIASDEILRWGGLVAVATMFGFQIWWPALWGGFGNPNDMAEALALLLPFLLWPALDPFKVRGKFLQTAIPIAVGYLAALWFLYVSPSRLGILAAAIGVTWVAINNMPKRDRAFFAVLLPLALAAAWFVFGDSLARSIMPRVQIWLAALDMWRAHFLFGVGLNGFEPSYPDYATADLRYWPGLHQQFLDLPDKRPGAVHNDWLQLAAETGAIGLAAVAWLVGRALKRGPMGPASVSVMIATGFSLVDFPMQKPGSALIAILALGVLTHKRHNL